MRSFLTLSLLAAAVGAQAPALDAGSFTLSRDGERIGRESFSVRRSAAAPGSPLLLQGTATRGSTRSTLALSTDAEGAPIKLQVEQRADGRVVAALSAEGGRGRFSARIRSDEVESAREFPLPEHAILLDDRFVHPFAVVVARAGGARRELTVVQPTRAGVATLSIEPMEGERLTIADTPIDAKRWRITSADGRNWTVWSDRDGRLLKVALPDGSVAVRDLPPE
ncbi:MAG: hypothetical protein K2X99_06080 [Gemmatimonadaceae bacterium]|nr:hypothetical protein [Gemmatimonadaceae bacterium]